MMSFTKESSEQEVSQYLREIYGFDLPHFELGLRNTETYFGFIQLKKKKAEFLKKIDDLESEKRKLIEHIDDFLSNSGLWNKIQCEDTPWTHERKVSYIKQEFRLNNVFEKVEKNIRSYRRKITILDGFRTEAEEKKKRIQHQTLISLVWFYSMFKGKVTNTQKFKDIGELLSWFSDNKPKFMDELFGEKIELDDPAIKANYDRYINNPNEHQKVYQELARSICAETLSPVDE